MDSKLERLVATPLGVVEWDATYRVTGFSARAEAILGFSAAEVMGRRLDEIPWVPEEDRPAVRAVMRVMLEGARPAPVSASRNVTRAGATIHCEWYDSAQYDAGGKLASVLSLVLDVTDRVRAEAALRDAEERYRTLFTSMGEGFALGEAICDAGGAAQDFRFLEMNEAFERQTGLCRADVRGRPMSEVLPNLERHWVDAYCGVALGGPPLRFENYNRDLDRHFEVFCYRPAPGRFAILFTDVNERRRADALLKESEERFRTLADGIPQLAWMADASGWISWYNRRWYDYTGTTLEEMEGWGWEKVHHPDHVEQAAARWRAGLASGREWEDVFPLRGRDGTFRWFLSRAKPILGADGKVFRWFGTNTDITAEREAQAALREADRRKTEFLAVLSHELRNPLAPIQNAVKLLELHDPGDVPERVRAREVIRRQADHLTNLVDDLLDLTRITHARVELHRERMDLGGAVQGSVDDHRALFEARGVALRCELPAEPLWVDGDATRLAQILANLLQNALKFTPPGGATTVAVAESDAGAEVVVRDTGSGIAPEMLARLFEPFAQADRTLARTQGGLGLGLALVKGLVELHGGAVSASSAGVGWGAAIGFRLPLAAAPRTTCAATGPAAPRRRRVVIIEDNVDAGDTLAEILAFDGHDVAVARDGRTGIALVQAQSPDVVLCDIGLPDMTGYDVARALRGGAGSPRLIAVSGYALPEDRARAADAGFDAHLAKPPPLEELSALLARLP